jgi:hypothetical protein
MFTSNLPYEDQEGVWPAWHDPFPEPQTIPSGWDMSEVLSPSTSEAITEPAVSTKS